MKPTILLLLLSITSFLVPAQTVIEKMTADVVFLADDELEGREVGTKGEQLAADYIAKRLDELGVKAKGTDDFFQTFSRKLEANPHSKEPVDTSIIVGRNVVGFIDNSAKTTVIIGGHYDHLGYGIEGSLHTGDPAIHNGADDNASGIAVMLHLAEKLLDGPRSNNYMFIAFSGEERGLWGSNFFAKEPTIRLEDVNYMINMDMVGRLNDEKTLAINGTGTSPVWKEELETLGGQRFKLVLSESGVGPSDHTSFYLKDIPVLHFFTGQHDDYHKPSDDVEKVNFEGMKLIGTYIYNLIANLDDDGKLAFLKTKDEDGKRSRKFSVTLGVVPDYLFDGKGMRISGVKPDRPAALAKLEEGDVVVKMGDLEINNMTDYMKGLGMFKPGDRTTVVVKRGDKELKKKIQF